MNYTLFLTVLNAPTGTYNATIQCDSPVGTGTLVDGTINVFLMGG